MDRRWPWKKKSSDKTVLDKVVAELDSAGGASNQSNQEVYKKPNYVQISVESYSHLTGLEDQVKTYEEKVQTLEDEITELNEKLSAANSEITTKEALVKQHAKVAEEAVSGWEKAEAEALALKNHLESVTLLKLSAEDQASQLDGALKECMRQIRNLKEEHELKIQDVALAKTRQLDKIKGDLEARIHNFEQELLRSAADNAALSRSLQERSNMLVKISEEKAHAEAEIEHHKSNIESCEREINSLKYELHVISKELEIRNEEKNMSMRSAEAANKQHMEGVKKITKLEAECQRLRGLVRKKLPGPAALAQMKLEVESLGRDYGETRLRKSPVKPASSHFSPLPDFSLENIQKFQKDNEFLTERLLTMEEETKMLKEALAKRNSELQASRSMCAKTLSKLQILEAQGQTSNQQKGSPKSPIHMNHESIYSQNTGYAPSMISISEDGNDDAGSCAESWSTAIISELSQIPKEKNTDESGKSEVTKKLELMDDFLEVEKFAGLSNDSNEDASVTVTSNNKTDEIMTNDVSEVSTSKDVPSESENKSDSNALPSQVSPTAVSPSLSGIDILSTEELQSRILSVFESTTKDTDICKILNDIKHVLDEAHDTSIQDSVAVITLDVTPTDSPCDKKDNPEDAGSIAEKELISSQEPTEYMQITSDIEAAISQIHDFVLFLGREAMTVHDISSDGDGISQKMEEFSVTYNKVKCHEASLRREKAKINGHPNLLDTDSTRKSTRETPLRKTNASSSSTQKSEQVEKATLPAPEARRKSERVEKKKTPSPLTKSGKTRNPSSSSSPSDSKSAGSLGSISRQKLQKEKSVKQLAFEAPEVTENEEHNVGTSQVKIKRMDARMYRSLFKDGKKGTIKKLSIGNCSDNKEVSKNGTLPSEDAKAKETRVDSSIDEQKCQSKGDNCSGAKIDELSKGSCSDINEVSKHGTLPSEDDKANETRVDSRLSGPMTNLAENNVTPGSFIPSNTPNYETSVVPIRVQSDCCREETLPTLASGNSILDDDDMVSNNAGLGGGENLAPSKRKVITVDTESNVSSTISKGDNANLIPDALPSKLGGNESCSKRTRLDYNPTVKESCDPCAAEDQDEDDTEPTMVQKDKSDYTSGIGHLKDSAVEDKNVLALDGQNDNEKDSLIYSSNESVVQPKEKLSSHIANRCKSDSYRFVEYWVPAQISHVQLEQYCATLLSNSSILCSSPKIDCVGAIRDVLISIRKCCNHPYVNDPSVQTLLFKDLEEVDYPSDKEKLVEYLNVGIKASGKLQLLDSMLTELRKNNLRALVLFQSIGKDSIGDILDDFLRQRFDVDSFERIDKSLSSSKKQAAMKKFNDKNNKRFVFLMETSACLPSIKLSSIDTVIIFDSDWNPMNDLRSLQKITLDSQFQFIKMFRLYTAFTAEEKALILATQDKALDINCLYSSRGLNHTLLMWGASRLFDELGVSLDGSTSTSSPIPLLEKTVSEFTSCLSDAGEDLDTSSRSILLKVQQNGGSYCSNFPLLGELKLGSLDEESPQTFWTKLLEGKHFRWKYSSSPSQRSRKRVHCFNNLEGGTNPVNEGITKKRMKVSNNTVDQPTSKSEGEKLPTGVKAGIFGDLVDKPQDNGVGSEKNGRIHDEQRSLHLLLKPQITKLCDVLLLPDNVKNMVDNFLEYVMNHHHVDREPVSILQAFQISLIWTAASLLNHKLDHKASLILAEQNLNFDCKKGEVDLIFSMLRCLKKIFLHRTENCNNTSSPKASKSPRVSCTGVAQEVELFKKDLSKSIKKIQKKCEKTLNKIRLMHQEEKQRLRASNEAQKAELERKYTIELAFTRSCSPNEVTRIEMLKILNIEHQKRIEDLEFQYETSLKDLEDKHSAHILKVQDCETTWVEDLKSWAKNELRNIVALKELGTGFDYSQMCDNVAESMKETGAVVPQKNSPSVDKTVEQQNSLVKHDRANEMDIMVSNDRAVSGNEDHNTTENQHVSQENILSKLSHSREQNSDGATSMTDEAIRSENFGHESRDGCEKPSLDTACLPDCREQNSDCATSMTDEDNRCANFGHRSRDGCEIPSLGTACLPDCENATHPVHQCSDGVSSSVPEGQIPGEVQETTNGGDSVSVSERQVHVEMSEAVNFTDCLLQSPPSYVAQISDRGSIDVPVIDGVSSPRPCQAACSTSCRDTISLSNPPLEQQIPDGLLSIPDGDIPVTVPENSHAVADCHKDIEPSTNAVLVDNSTTNDLEGGVLGTVTSAPVSSRPVNVMEPLEQGQQLPSVESAADKDSAGEMQNSYEQVQLASRSADVVPANQITVPPKQVHQLAAAELSSNLGMLGLSNFHLATEDEHQPSNVPDIPTHHPEPSSAVPNKNVAQPHSNSALFLHSNQAAVHPVSNSDLDSVTASRVRTQSANPRNLSTPLEMNNHPIQSTAPSSSTRLPHLSYDPLKIEFEKIQKAIEQTSKSHEDSKLRLKSDFEKELAELRKKYDVKFQEMEVEFQRTKKTLDTNLNTVCVNKLLADAFRSKCLDLKAPGASGMQHDSLPRQLHHRSSQQTATRSLVVSGSSGQPPATSLLSPSIAPSQPPATSLLSPPIAPKSQHMVPPGYNKSGTSSGVSARPPLINTTRSSIARDVQTGGEIRAPAPHLQSSRPPNSVPPSSFHPLLLRNLSQTAPSNLRATSPSHARVPPLQRPTAHQSNPQTGYRPDSAGRLATPNLPLTGSHGNVSNQSNITSPNVISRLSDTAPANLSRFGPNSSSMVVNSSHQAASADLVCLSDDDD